MNKAPVIFIMILLFAGFFPGVVLKTAAPIYDMGGMSSLFDMAPLYGADIAAVAPAAEAQAQPDQSKTVCENTVLWRVLFVTLVIWIGISAYLVFLHVRISALEKKLNE